MNPQEQIDKLQRDLNALIEEVYRNNFSGRQDFTKYSNFTTKLKVPHLTALPTVGETGEIFEYSGKLYICSATNTFTVVGTQT